MEKRRELEKKKRKKGVEGEREMKRERKGVKGGKGMDRAKEGCVSNTLKGRQRGHAGMGMGPTLHGGWFKGCKEVRNKYKRLG